MEIHKHPHHVTHKKKWGEYLLEFFMLFLAVFLGFIAENIRENKVEKKQGREYIKSFVEDLKQDTAQFKKLAREYNYYDSVTNKIFSCYDTLSHNATSTGCLKEIIPYLTRFTDFIYTDRTIQQLKNAGGLRLISDKDVSDSIIDYDALVRQEFIHQEVLEINQAKSIEAVRSEVDFLSFSLLYPGKDERAVKPVLLATDKAAIDNLFNALWVFKSTLRGQNHYITNLDAKATRLIYYLEKKENN